MEKEIIAREKAYTHTLYIVYNYIRMYITVKRKIAAYTAKSPTKYAMCI